MQFLSSPFSLFCIRYHQYNYGQYMHIGCIPLIQHRYPIKIARSVSYATHDESSFIT